MSQDKIVRKAIEIAASEGRAPEQSDFMTAAVLNQNSMTEQERGWLQADLRAAELGTSSESILGSCFPIEDDYIDGELYGELCGGCGEDLNYCRCSDEPEPPKYFRVIAECSNPNWVDFDLAVHEFDVESTQKKFVENHKKQCGCDGEVKFYVDEIK